MLTPALMITYVQEKVKALLMKFLTGSTPMFCMFKYINHFLFIFSFQLDVAIVKSVIFKFCIYILYVVNA